MVVHTCNPSYSGRGGSRRIGSEASLGKVSETISETQKKRTEDMTHMLTAIPKFRKKNSDNIKAWRGSLLDY
jgi:hypothetical protein